MHAGQDALGRALSCSLQIRPKHVPTRSLATRARDSVARTPSEISLSSLGLDLTSPRNSRTLADKETHGKRRIPSQYPPRQHSHSHAPYTAARRRTGTKTNKRLSKDSICTHTLSRVYLTTQPLNDVFGRPKRCFTSFSQTQSDDLHEQDLDDFETPNGQAGEGSILAQPQENQLDATVLYGQPPPSTNENNEHPVRSKETESQNGEKTGQRPLLFPEDLLSGFDEFTRCEREKWITRCQVSMLMTDAQIARRKTYQHEIGNTRSWNDLFRDFMVVAGPLCGHNSSITLAGLRHDITELSLALSECSIPCALPTLFGDGSFLKISGSRLFVLAVLDAFTGLEDFLITHVNLAAEKTMAARVLYLDTFDMLQELEKRKQANLALEEEQEQEQNDEQEDEPESEYQYEITVPFVARLTRGNAAPRFHPAYRSNPEIALELARLVQDMSLHPELSIKEGMDMIVKFFVDLGRIGIGRTIMAHMYEMGIPPDQKTYSAFFNTAAAEQNLEAFSVVTNDMLGSGIEPNDTSWNGLLLATPEKQQKQLILREMHRRSIFTSSNAPIYMVPGIIAYALEPHLARGGTVWSYMDTLTQTFGPAWLSQRALGRITSILVRTMRFAEALAVIDRLAATGIYHPQVHVYTVMIRQCDMQKNLLCAVAIAIHALRYHQATARPNRRFFTRIFLIAWRCRRLNTVRVVWKYACAAGHMSGFMVRKFLASLRCSAEGVVAPGEEEWWLGIAGVFICGGHVRGLTDDASRAVRQRRRREAGYRGRDARGDRDSPDSVYEPFEESNRTLLPDEPFEPEYPIDADPDPDVDPDADPDPEAALETETFITTILHEEQETYGTYEELRPFEDALDEALRLDYDAEWEHRVERGLREVEWLLRHGVDVPLRKKGMRVARGMLERYRALVEH